MNHNPAPGQFEVGEDAADETDNGTGVVQLQRT